MPATARYSFLDRTVKEIVLLYMLLRFSRQIHMQLNSATGDEKFIKDYAEFYLFLIRLIRVIRVLVFPAGIGRFGMIAMMADHYEIRVKGHIDPGWADYFDSLQLTHHADGTTLLAGLIPDQPALLGLLMRIGSLGLSILDVKNTDYHADKEN